MRCMKDDFVTGPINHRLKLVSFLEDPGKHYCVAAMWHVPWAYLTPRGLFGKFGNESFNICETDHMHI